MNATVRSLDDAKAKQAMLSQYIAECERIDAFKAKFMQEVGSENCHLGEDLADWLITIGERLEVFERRRDRLLGELTNKGIRIHAESETLKSLAGVIEQNHAKDQT